MSSFENERPGMSPRFLSQKIAQKDPLKKIPSTHANATRRWANGASLESHSSAHSAFLLTEGTVSMARNRSAFSAGSLTSLSIMSEYVSEWILSLNP